MSVFTRGTLSSLRVVRTWTAIESGVITTFERHLDRHIESKACMAELGVGRIYIDVDQRQINVISAVCQLGPHASGGLKGLFPPYSVMPMSLRRLSIVQSDELRYNAEHRNSTGERCPIARLCT